MEHPHVPVQFHSENIATAGQRGDFVRDGESLLRPHIPVASLISSNFVYKCERVRKV